MDIDQLKIDLELLSNISPGDTIDIDNKIIIIRNSWSRWWRGWARGECRNNTINFIEGLCQRTKIYHKHIDLILIESAASGIQNLELTYANDSDSILRLRTSRSNLDELWIQRKKTIPMLIHAQNNTYNGKYWGQSSSFPLYDK